MKKLTYAFLFLLMLSGLASMAQMPEMKRDTSAGSGNLPEGNGKIHGQIIDSVSLAPVEFALISLIDENTGKPVDGTMCDEEGKFSLVKVRTGNYKIQVSFFDYKTLTIDGVIVSESQRTIDLGKIKLGEDTRQLKEIVVEGERALIEEKVDRLVYNAENDANNQGGDAADVLRKVPLLTVDMDGNVSLRGNQNVRVLINNKPSSIMAGNIADALKQIPSDQIKSVEVITAPSARYDAEGSSGIINIITKKNNLQGFSLGVDASAGVRGSSLGLNGSYRKGKMGFTLGGHGRAGYNINGRYENEQLTTNNGIQTLNTQRADTRNQRLFGNYTFGWDYDIDKRNSINSTVKYSFRNGNTRQDNLFTESYINDLLNRQNTRNVNVSDLSGTIDLSLNYLHLFDKPQHEFSLLGLFSRNNRSNDFVNTILDSSDLDLVASRLKNLNNSYNQEWTLQADYQRPIGKSQIVEVGAKNINRDVSSDFQYFFAVGPDGEYVQTQNTNQNNGLRYNQNVTAGYLSYTLNFLKNYTLKAGGRYEHTIIDARQKDNTVLAIPSYGILVPSVNLARKFKNGNMLKASFSRRVQRPSIQFLNPNIQASNPLNITIGNPSLNPEYTNNYELSYSTYVKNSSFTFMGFVRTTNNAIQSVRDIVGSDTIRTTYQNIGEENAYGMNLHTGINISSKLRINGGVDAFYAVLSNNVPNPLYNASNEGWVVSGRVSGTYNFTKTLALQLFSFYRGRQVNLQGYQGGFGMYSLSLRKEFADKKGSIGFGAENFFTPAMYIRSGLESPVISQKSMNVMHNMNFKINFSYRIGKMTTEDRKTKRRRSINNDDMKEEGDNSPIGNSNMQQQQQNTAPSRSR